MAGTAGPALDETGSRPERGLRCDPAPPPSRLVAGEAGGPSAQLPDLEGPAKTAEGPAKESKVLPPARASSAAGAFPPRAKAERKSPPVTPANCVLQLPSPRKTERPPRLSLYRPSLLTTLQPFHHLPNFRKPGSGFSASAYVASKRLGEKAPARAAALGSASAGLSKQVHSLYSMTPCP